MVVCLVLRANVGEDYQPKGFNSCWTALSPQGNDALERSLYQMREKIQLVLLEEMQQELYFSRDYRHQQNSYSLPLVSSPLLSPDRRLPSVAFLIKNHNISDAVRESSELVRLEYARGQSGHLGAISAWHSRKGRGERQRAGRTLLHLMPVCYLGGVTLPFDVNLLDISFTVLLATPFRDLRGAR